MARGTSTDVRIVLLLLSHVLAVGHAATVRIALSQAGATPAPGALAAADITLSVSLSLSLLVNSSGWTTNNMTVALTIDRLVTSEASAIAAAQQNQV